MTFIQTMAIAAAALALVAQEPRLAGVGAQDPQLLSHRDEPHRGQG